MSRPRLIALLLALGTLVVFLPVGRFGFVNYDDPAYITENAVVKNGLTWAGIVWAFAGFHVANWHPLTWLSHMADCSLFGVNPGAMHFVNVLFHAANAALLFTLLLRLTKIIWPSALVAALFAWHPLHVESVAWIAERKDVLSTFFALLALLNYARYVELSQAKSPSAKIYFVWSLLAFAFSLLAKPMFVTLPFVLLLLDFWPLKRFPLSAFPPSLRFGAARRFPLLLEKIPFFLLVIPMVIVTCLAQRGAMATLERVPFALRLENSLVAYVAYLLKIFWPVNLAFFYPLFAAPFRALLAAAIGLAAISIFAWRTRRAQPYVMMGWLWFLGMLVPVIGLVQVGGAALADRYTYFSATGIFILATFGACALAKRFQFPKWILPAAALVILAACLALMENQLRYWRNGVALFTHAVATTKNNDVALLDLGVALDAQGRFEEALVPYREALRIAPERYQIHNNLGNILGILGRPEEALAEYREAVRLKPDLAFLHNGTGQTLAQLGRFDEAAAEFAVAARLDPGFASPHFELAKTLLKQGRDAEAIDQFRATLRLEPDNYQILAAIARVLAAIENPEVRDGKNALILAAKANALTGGGQLLVLDALAMACAETGDFTNAQEVAQRAFELAAAAKLKNLESFQQRLQLYQHHQPWRESFRATNAPPPAPPKK